MKSNQKNFSDSNLRLPQNKGGFILKGGFYSDNYHWYRVVKTQAGLTHFHLEFEAHILPKSVLLISTTKPPIMNFKLQVEVVEPGHEYCKIEPKIEEKSMDFGRLKKVLLYIVVRS